jgi:osmotically-inducible protein OsmY
VNNQLQVVPEARREQVNAADDKVSEAIDKLAESDDRLTGLFITTNAGVVSLRGEVENYEQLVYAAQTLRKVPGVRAVDASAVRVADQAPKN